MEERILRTIGGMVPLATFSSPLPPSQIPCTGRKLVNQPLISLFVQVGANPLFPSFPGGQRPNDKAICVDGKFHFLSQIELLQPDFGNPDASRSFRCARFEFL